MSSVLPSGADFATSSAPIEPAAPARLSTITLDFSASPSINAYGRATMSVGPPAGNGTTSRTGPDKAAEVSPIHADAMTKEQRMPRGICMAIAPRNLSANCRARHLLQRHHTHPEHRLVADI